MTREGRIPDREGLSKFWTEQCLFSGKWTAVGTMTYGSISLQFNELCADSKLAHDLHCLDV